MLSSHPIRTEPPLDKNAIPRMSFLLALPGLFLVYVATVFVLFSSVVILTGHDEYHTWLENSIIVGVFGVAVSVLSLGVGCMEQLRRNSPTPVTDTALLISKEEHEPA